MGIECRFLAGIGESLKGTGGMDDVFGSFSDASCGWNPYSRRFVVGSFDR